jgi:hypothetical protein
MNCLPPVHVVGSRSGVITEPDTEVLDLEGLPLPELINQFIKSTLPDFPALKSKSLCELGFEESGGVYLGTGTM